MEPEKKAEGSEGISQIKNILEFIKTVRWFISAYIALAAFLLVKKYAYDIVRVNNRDMHGTFKYGDALLIQKQAGDLKRGDLIHLEYPLSDTALSRTFFIQRIVGLPGDSVEIIDKKVVVNGKPFDDTATVKHNYYVKTRGVKLDSIFLLRHKVLDGGSVSDQFDYSFALSDAEAEQLKADSIVSAVTLKAEKRGSFDEACFPNSPHFSWNMDNYGKIYVPRLGDTLKLDSVSMYLYRRLIADLEKNELETDGLNFIINGEPATYYVVKKDYYFVLGDNRDNANDSRIWGYLPENFVRGKVLRKIRGIP